MEIFVLAAVSLVFFLWYDVWTVIKPGCPWMRLTFALGFGCMAAATVRILMRVWANVRSAPLRAGLFGVAALAFLALLIFTLFFSLPFEQTYRTPQRQRPVCRAGMYALCRHPGVLWFFFFYGSIYLGAPDFYTLWGGGTLCACNLLYIVFQDSWTFPRIFTDYKNYRHSVPFLIPTPRSIRSALHSGRAGRSSVHEDRGKNPRG